MSPTKTKTKKGFINYVFFRNLAVRNPAGTRLDSSSPELQKVRNLGTRFLTPPPPLHVPCPHPPPPRLFFTIVVNITCYVMVSGKLMSLVKTTITLKSKTWAKHTHEKQIHSLACVNTKHRSQNTLFILCWQNNNNETSNACLNIAT